MKFKKLKLKTKKGDRKKIAITKNPSIGIKGLAFSMEPMDFVVEPKAGESESEREKDNSFSFKFKIDEKKQILVAPVMIPNLVMIKKIDGVATEVFFDEEEVRNFMIDFEREYIERNGDVFNLEHKNKMVPVTRLESWYVEGEGDKARSVYGFDVPDGTPMLSLYIEDKEFFENYVEAGVGFSIEGFFIFEEEEEEKIENDLIPDEFKEIWNKLIGK